MKVLVADDDLISRKVLTSLLERQGHEVEAVGNGAAALYVLHNQHPDLLLLDMKMPIVSGEQVIREVRAMDGEKGRLPVIVVTARAMKGDRDEIMRIGASAYISKPYLLEDMLAAIKAVTSQTSPASQTSQAGEMGEHTRKAG